MKRTGLLHKRKGFTLLEALFAVLLIGLGVVSLVAASGAFTMANAAGLDLSTAEFLMEEVREMTAATPFDNLPALNGQTYSPPVDAAGTALPEFAAYSQRVLAQNVSPANLSSPQAGSDFIRLTVIVTKNGRQINSVDWIRARLD